MHEAHQAEDAHHDYGHTHEGEYEEVDWEINEIEELIEYFPVDE